jgi:hypothetical protein
MQVPGAVGEKEKIKKVWKTVAYFPDPWVGSGSPGDIILTELASIDVLTSQDLAPLNVALTPRITPQLHRLCFIFTYSYDPQAVLLVGMKRIL